MANDGCWTVGRQLEIVRNSVPAIEVLCFMFVQCIAAAVDHKQLCPLSGDRSAVLSQHTHEKQTLFQLISSGCSLVEFSLLCSSLSTAN